MPTNKIKKLKQLLEILNDGVSAADFKTTISRILKFLTSLKEKNQTEFKNLNQKISDSTDKLKGDNSTDISTLKAELSKLIDVALIDQASGMNLIRDKVRKIREGTDGKDGKNGIDGVGRDGKDGKDGVDAPVDTPRQTRKKIKLLKKKLRIKDIKGLRKELDKRGKVIYTGASSSAGIGGSVRYYDLSSELDGGTTRTFALPAFARIIDVKLSSLPVMREDTDYTVDGSDFKITFLSEVSDNRLSAGQSCWIIYAEM